MFSELHVPWGVRPASSRQAMPILTEQEVANFWRQGFIAIPRTMVAEELESIHALYVGAFAACAGWDEGNYFDLVGISDDPSQFRIPHLQRITDYCPALLETHYFRLAGQIAQQLLGGPAKHLYDIAITKPPGSLAETPWHQDAAFLLEPSYFETIVFWMPLQPVDAANGCMKFVPGSHRGPIVKHRSPGGDVRVNGLEALDIDVSGAVACPLPAGGLTIHHFRTLHGTGGNHSGNARHALTFGFGARRPRPTVSGGFDWLLTKDNARLHRWRTRRAMNILKQLVRPHVSWLMQVGR